MLLLLLLLLWLMQMWPHMPAPSLWPRSLPPLLSPKLKAVLRLLADKQQQQEGWAGIVFVERKVGTGGLVAHCGAVHCWT
jgi:hypothetical protein